MKLILSSKSPRRRELIKYLGYPFEIKTAEASEAHDPSLSPADTVKFISRKKAEAAFKSFGIGAGEVIIGSDTIVAAKDEILGKPRDYDDAVRMLRKLSGCTHSVHTGVTLIYKTADGKTVFDTFSEKTDVTVAALTDFDIKNYIENDPPYDKAGSYAIQGPFSAHITSICGDYNNVVGFPVAAILLRLREIEPAL